MSKLNIMSDKDFFYFRLLKEGLVKKLQETHPEIRNEISDWKGKEILFFQQDLEKHVNGRISEKSFYTHFKSDKDKIPRIDVLNLFCEYVGHDNWIQFRNHNQHKFQNRRYIRFGILTIVTILVAIALSVILKPKSYSISVVNAYSNKIIPSDQLKITQLYDDQSPKEIDDIDDSIFTFRTSTSKVEFIVDAPYFHKDTIVRKVGHFSNHENIRLFPDDYALIIHSLSRSKNEDWIKRRSQLAGIIAENARIIQVNDIGGIAIELYNKSEFINKLTIPVNSLKNIDIIDIKHDNERISELRFIQKKGENND